MGSDQDLKIIEHLRPIRAGQVVAPDLTKLHPSYLPQSFSFSSNPLQLRADPLQLRADLWETQHGSWKVKVGSFFAVTTEHGKCVGAKRTMEFHQNGTVTDWLMEQYFKLNWDEYLLMELEDDVSFCRVYQQKRKGPLHEKESSRPNEDLFANFVSEDYGIDGLLPSWHEYNSPFSHENLNGQNQQAANNQEAVLPKTKRKSDVWNDFTKIYVKDAGGNLKQEYAMCNSCHILLRSPSSYGTSHLRSHTGTCPCKRLLQQTQ